MGNLIITYILINPPEIWKGLKGYIDDDILFDWLSSNINIDHMSVAPTKIISYPRQQFVNNFDEFNAPFIMPHFQGEQQQHSISQDPLIESSTSHSTIINNFPDNSKIIVCGNSGFMISIQNICSRIGIKEKNILFLV
jgi:hypothetical protein